MSPAINTSSSNLVITHIFAVMPLAVQLLRKGHVISLDDCYGTGILLHRLRSGLNRTAGVGADA